MIFFPGFVRASGRVQNDHPSKKMFLIPKEVAGINVLMHNSTAGSQLRIKTPTSLLSL